MCDDEWNTDHRRWSKNVLLRRTSIKKMWSLLNWIYSQSYCSDYGQCKFLHSYVFGIWVSSIHCTNISTPFYFLDLCARNESTAKIFLLQPRSKSFATMTCKILIRCQTATSRRKLLTQLRHRQKSFIRRFLRDPYATLSAKLWFNFHFT